jgi:cobalt-zinc-cadmium efflux system outer membrane protein
MNFPCFLRIYLAGAAFAASTAVAQESPGGTLTMAQALALTLRKSPALAASSWDIRAAEAQVIQARLKPNPELNLTAEDVTGSGDYSSGDNAEHTLQLSQLVELGGKRAARTAQAQINTTLAGFDYQVLRVSVLRNTTQAFVEVLVAQRRLALAEETLRLWENAVPLTQKRFEKGASPEVELTRATVAVDLAQISVDQSRRDLLSAKAVLASQWGENRAVSFETVVGNLDYTEPLPAFNSLVNRLGNHPQLARWTAEREHREAILRTEQAQAVPNLTVGVGPRVVGRGDNFTMGVISFTLPLPLFNRNEGNIAEARALIAKARPEEREIQARAFAELSVAYQTMRRASDIITKLKGSVLPAAEKTVELFSEGYAAGRFSQLEILDARRTLTDVRDRYLQALADYHKAVADMEALTAQPVELHGHLSKSISKPPAKGSR